MRYERPPIHSFLAGRMLAGWLCISWWCAADTYPGAAGASVQEPRAGRGATQQLGPSPPPSPPKPALHCMFLSPAGGVAPIYHLAVDFLSS